jgi:NTP pyrophosphatase (non-canonical NTP hydrolase)
MQLCCTISGSFRRFMPEIQLAMAELRQNDVKVLSPAEGPPMYETNGFVVLEGDRGVPQEIEERHLDAVRRSDFVYVVNPSGYIGPSATLEIGYAFALGIPVFSSHSANEFALSLAISSSGAISEIVSRIKKASRSIPAKGDLRMLQCYIHNVVKERGFDSETSRDVMLLLVEEIGELAKAIRKDIGLKMDPNKKYSKSVPQELADCLIYLLDLANLTKTDMSDAFYEKEQDNALRWPRDPI